jgi:hypothetical protein
MRRHRQAEACRLVVVTVFVLMLCIITTRAGGPVGHPECLVPVVRDRLERLAQQRTPGQNLPDFLLSCITHNGSVFTLLECTARNDSSADPLTFPASRRRRYGSPDCSGFSSRPSKRKSNPRACSKSLSKSSSCIIMLTSGCFDRADWSWPQILEEHPTLSLRQHPYRNLDIAFAMPNLSHRAARSKCLYLNMLRHSRVFRIRDSAWGCAAKWSSRRRIIQHRRPAPNCRSVLNHSGTMGGPRCRTRDSEYPETDIDATKAKDTKRMGVEPPRTPRGADGRSCHERKKRMGAEKIGSVSSGLASAAPVGQCVSSRLSMSGFGE